MTSKPGSADFKSYSSTLKYEFTGHSFFSYFYKGMSLSFALCLLPDHAFHESQNDQLP